MSTTRDWDDLAALIEAVDSHLDANVSATYQAQPLAQDWARVAKVTEEAGEAVDALIGLTGQNPRKGVYGDLDHLLDELADVALATVYAIQHFTKDAGKTLDRIFTRSEVHRGRLAAAAPTVEHPATPPPS